MVRILLVLFILLVIIPTIVLADLGRLPGFLSWLYAFPEGDKLGHFSLYGILAFLLVMVVPIRDAEKPWKPPLLACCLLIVLIGIEEISQLVFRTRSADVVDFVFSVIGVIALGYLAWRIRRRRISPGLD